MFQHFMLHLKAHHLSFTENFQPSWLQVKYLKCDLNTPQKFKIQ